MSDAKVVEEAVAPRKGVRAAGTGHVVFSEGETAALLTALAEPLDPSIVKWKVSATRKRNRGFVQGQVLAYVDPRAYSDRLNQLVSPGGWTRRYWVQVVPNFERKGRDQKSSIGAKVMVVCKVMIFGLGEHCGTGEQWADNENALTNADAQAFKRACVCFGLGRYLYNLPGVWVDLDEFKRPLRTPTLPPWAHPQARNGSSKVNGGANGHRPGADPHHTSANGHNGHGHSQMSAAAMTAGGKEGVTPSGDLLKEIEELVRKLGQKLSGSIVESSIGSREFAEVTDAVQLMALRERLANACRGVDWLRQAVAKAGPEAYAVVCEELGLLGMPIEEIPDIQMLRELVERFEARIKSDPHVGGHAEGEICERVGRAEDSKDSRSGSHAGFVSVQASLVTLARQRSAATGRSMSEIIAFASNRSFKYSDIGRMTDKDSSKLVAAVRRLKEAASSSEL